MKYNVHYLPSPGFLTYQLSKNEMDFIWERIAEATDPGKDPNLYNKQLAGNISKSFDMGLHNLEIINDIVFPLVSTGVVVSSSLIGFFIFNENLSRANWIGILLSVCAIYIFSF